MTEPRKPEPLTESEEQEWRKVANADATFADRIRGAGAVSRIWATVDTARERIAEVERERDEAIAEQGTLYKLIAQVERERDEARKHPGINDPRVAAINDAVTDFLTRKDNPRLVCFHVPVINCEVLMFAVGEGLPKVISYAQFIHTLERSAGIGADSSTAVERDALRKFSDAYDRCDSNRGAFSCCEQHDCRCMKARHPDKPCECGRDEMDAAYEEARRLRAASEGGERG